MLYYASLSATHILQCKICCSTIRMLLSVHKVAVHICIIMSLILDEIDGFPWMLIQHSGQHVWHIIAPYCISLCLERNHVLLYKLQDVVQVVLWISEESKKKLKRTNFLRPCPYSLQFHRACSHHSSLPQQCWHRQALSCRVHVFLSSCHTSLQLRHISPRVS